MANGGADKGGVGERLVETEIGYFDSNNTFQIRYYTDGIQQTALKLGQNGVVEVPVLSVTGGSDIVEPFAITEDATIEPGTVMVIDAQMPVRAKRIQYFDDRLFKAIHAAQTGELPFPELGGGGSQGTLPLSMRAMPMTPPLDGSGGSEADVEAERQAADGQSSGKTDVAPKKTSPVVQAVIAEEQRQIEMDFGGEVAALGSVKDADVEQVRTAVHDLGELETALRQGL